ncbi:hypothetical protein GC197_00890 [bacterium]|nr:hypothetical protein [bacterium]
MKTLSLLPIVVLLATCAAWAQDPLAAPYEGILVLTNGNAMRGRITQEGEYYSLAINQDSIVRLPAERVAFACRTLAEAYQKQRTRIGTTTLHDHVVLANWCLDVGLWKEASYHHAIAVRSGPDDRDVVLLDRRYQIQFEKRIHPNQVEQASYQQPALPMPVDNPVEEPDDSEDEPLLPPDVIRYYTNTVQPIMLNGCAASRCHAPGVENRFQLTQFGGVRSMPRRITLKNIHGVLDFVDYEKPSQSVLLTKASTRHGDGSSPNLSPGQFQAIRNWVFAVSQTTPRKLATESSSVVPASFQVPVQTPKALQQPGSQAESLPATPPANSIFGGNANASLGGIRKPFREMPQKGIPQEEAPKVRDEFDPELFNRRFHPDRQVPLFPE